MRTPLTEAQRELAERHVPLAKAIARPFKQRWPNDGAELDSAVMMALVYAAGSWDPARDVKFATFAWPRIEGAVKDVRREKLPPGYRRGAGNLPEISPLFAGVEGLGAVLGSTPDPPACEAVDALDAVERLIGSLPARHSPLFRLVYGRGLGVAEAGRRLGYSKSLSEKIHGEGLAYLRGDRRPGPSPFQLAKAARDHAIREGRRAGAGFRDLAERFGLSEHRVWVICMGIPKPPRNTKTERG